MIKIDDRVSLQKTGLPCSGTVIGISRAKMCSVYSKGSQYWDSLYPGWRDELVVYIEYDEPQKQCSFEEFCLGYPHSQFIPKPILQQEYQKVPTTTICVAPIRDVITFDSILNFSE
jgi:hypothetical protein